MKRIKYKTAINRVRDSECPVCGKFEVTYGDLEVNSAICFQTASCVCGAEWTEYYVQWGIADTSSSEKNFFKVTGDLSGIENLPEIILAVLSQKQVLPALLGIDKEFDKMIEERLRE